MSVESDRLTVLFEDVGYKTLALAAVQKQQLLTLEDESDGRRAS
jgi:ATP-dependent DNA helicase RecQ